MKYTCPYSLNDRGDTTLIFLRALLLCLLTLLATCHREARSLELNEPVHGRIHAGSVRSFGLKVPAGYVARVSLRQQEIDLSLRVPGVIVENSAWGTEVAYLTGVQSLQVVADSNHSRQGGFTLSLDSLHPISGPDRVALEAQRRLAEGHVLLNRRTAQTQKAAEETLRIAVDLWHEAGDPHQEAAALVAWGRSLERRDAYAAADAAYDRAIHLFRQTGDPAARLDAQKASLNLGGHLGQERGSVAVLQEMQKEWQALGERRGVARMVSGLAKQLEAMGHQNQAIDSLKTVLKLNRELGDRDGAAEVWLQLAGFATKAKQYEAATTDIHQAAAIYRDLHDLVGERDCQQGLADVHGLTGRHKEALAAYGRIRQIHAERGDWSAWRSITTQMASSAGLLGRTEQAWTYLKEWENQSPLVGSPSSVFALANGPWVAANLTIRNTDPGFNERAFDFVDRSRARFFGGRTDLGSQTIKQALEPQDILLEFIGGISAKEPAALWAVTRNQMTFHRLPPPGFLALSQAVAAEFAARPSPTDSIIGSGQSARRRQLAQLLLGPIAGGMHAKRLLIVPDERLGGIPFAALPDPERTDGSLLGDHHEIVYLPSAQAVLALRQQSRLDSNDSFTLFSDPVMNRYDTRLRANSATPPDTPPETADWVATARSAGVFQEAMGLPRLANAAQESVTLGAMRPGRTRLLNGFEATHDSATTLAPRARFLHIGTHGFVDHDRPDHSGLALTLWNRQGKSVDGFWRFDEIAMSRFAAELVTLGACETGIGRRIGYQGVPSLSNAFLRAGARRVVSALWKVDDAATSALMIEFYRQLFSDAKPTPALALHLAQKRVASQPKWSDPYYWAGFVLYGDWRPL